MNRMTLADAMAHQARVRARPGSLAAIGETPQPSPSKKSRRPARRKVVDGIEFHSQFEARQYESLKALQLVGVIQQLRVHHAWPLMVGGEEVATWESDFDYLQDGKPVVVDAKGYSEEVYRLKFKLFNAIYKPLRITEIRQTKRYKAG
jgi:hypothetical protein